MLNKAEPARKPNQASAPNEDELITLLLQTANMADGTKGKQRLLDQSAEFYNRRIASYQDTNNSDTGAGEDEVPDKILALTLLSLSQSHFATLRKILQLYHHCSYIEEQVRNIEPADMLQLLLFYSQAIQIYIDRLLFDLGKNLDRTEPQRQTQQNEKNTRKELFAKLLAGGEENLELTDAVFGCLSIAEPSQVAEFVNMFKIYADRGEHNSLERFLRQLDARHFVTLLLKADQLPQNANNQEAMRLSQLLLGGNSVSGSPSNLAAIVIEKTETGPDSQQQKIIAGVSLVAGLASHRPNLTVEQLLEGEEVRGLLPQEIDNTLLTQAIYQITHNRENLTITCNEALTYLKLIGQLQTDNHQKHKLAFDVIKKVGGSDDEKQELAKKLISEAFTTAQSRDACSLNYLAETDSATRYIVELNNAPRRISRNFYQILNSLDSSLAANKPETSPSCARRRYIVRSEHK